MQKLLIIIIALLTLPAIRAGESIDIEAELQLLDDVVEKRYEYITAKTNSINNYKRNHSQYADGMAQFTYYKHLYDEYSSFNSDSARIYALRIIEVSQEFGLDVGVEIGQIDLTLVTLRKSDLAGARNMIAQLKPIEEYEPSLRPNVAIVFLENGMRNNLLRTTNYGSKPEEVKRKIWETYSPYIPQDNWMRAYYKTHVIDQGDPDELLGHLASTPEPSIQAAMLYSALAQTVLKANDNDLYLHYLIRSAINDIMCANREASSLMSVLRTPQIDKTSRRAMEYANACAENVRDYNDAGRSLGVVGINSTIAIAYQEKLEQNEVVLKAVIAFLAVAIVAIIVMLVVLIRKRRKQTAINKTLHEISSELRQKIDEGKVMQEEVKKNYEMLQDEIHQRNRNFIDVYMLVSNYINDISDYKKAVYNMITAGKVDKARRELASTSINEKYLREFYKQFDKAFIRTHPDFVERFNALMKPEERIIPPEESLTPELRIFALMSIGITDGTSIADFLQYSVQTIYNYRMRVRRSAIVDEKDFDATIENMYS